MGAKKSHYLRFGKRRSLGLLASLASSVGLGGRLFLAKTTGDLALRLLAGLFVACATELGRLLLFRDILRDR